MYAPMNTIIMGCTMLSNTYTQLGITVSTFGIQVLGWKLKRDPSQQSIAINWT
jgi:hypothetical protein